jgi:N-acetylglucosaminyldiphosphoundecaprenol N-acetyl-beta-D-mannosaminyltransferase
MILLNVRIDNFTKKEIFEKVSSFLSESKFHQIATINPEFILEAQKNEAFRNILNNCDLNIADGIGIKFASWRYGKHLKRRLTGVDLMREILRISDDRGLGIFLVANKDGLSTWEETRDEILKIYPRVNIFGVNLNKNDFSYKIPTYPAGPVGEQDAKYQILFCNFGAPYQELFINCQKNDTIRLAIGVGGSFDFLTGKTKRAPVLVCKLGFEWLWRVFQQPENKLGRLKRIWNAVVVFPKKVIFNKENNMSSKIRIVRNAYLYIASLVSLIFVAVGAYILLNTAIKYYVLPKAEKGGYSRCNEQPPIYDIENVKSATTDEAKKEQFDQLIKDYENWKNNNTGEECYKADRQSNVADAITMIIIALPIFLFHWRLIRKEKEEKELET